MGLKFVFVRGFVLGKQWEEHDGSFLSALGNGSPSQSSEFYGILSRWLLSIGCLSRSLFCWVSIPICVRMIVCPIRKGTLGSDHSLFPFFSSSNSTHSLAWQVGLWKWGLLTELSIPLAQLFRLLIPEKGKRVLFLHLFLSPIRPFPFRVGK